MSGRLSFLVVVLGLLVVQSKAAAQADCGEVLRVRIANEYRIATSTSTETSASSSFCADTKKTSCSSRNFSGGVTLPIEGIPVTFSSDYAKDNCDDLREAFCTNAHSAASAQSLVRIAASLVPQEALNTIVSAWSQCRRGGGEAQYVQAEVKPAAAGSHSHLITPWFTPPPVPFETNFVAHLDAAAIVAGAATCDPELATLKNIPLKSRALAASITTCTPSDPTTATVIKLSSDGWGEVLAAIAAERPRTLEVKLLGSAKDWTGESSDVIKLNPDRKLDPAARSAAERCFVLRELSYGGTNNSTGAYSSMSEVTMNNVTLLPVSTPSGMRSDMLEGNNSLATLRTPIPVDLTVNELRGRCGYGSSGHPGDECPQTTGSASKLTLAGTASLIERQNPAGGKAWECAD